LEVLNPRCAGLDVHKDSVVACARIHGERVEQVVETFGTTTSELERLAAFLSKHGVSHVAMEATGSYWKPVWAVLSDEFELILANAAHVKNVPGRKTDVNDAMWLADLLAHGLIRASFVPAPEVQALRDLTRTRKQLTREKASHVQRIDKVLQTANIKLSSVLTDIMGQSGRAILDAMAAGTTDPNALADLVRTRVRAPRSKIVEALRGRLTPHQRLLLQVHLTQIDSFDAAIARIDEEVGERLDPFREAVEKLVSIPGVSEVSAAVIVSEIGFDMGRFASAPHLISWAGLCPRNDQSAGKRRSTKLRKGAPWLKTLLVQTAWCASRAKGTYLRALFGRLKTRRGPRKAIMAVAASILTSIYWMLKRNLSYTDLGPDHFDRTDRSNLAKRLARKLDELGYDVTLADRKAA
jgi:transposase